MKYRELLSAVTEKFRGTELEDPTFEARQLLQEALGVNATQMILQEDEELDPALTEKVQAWTSRRATGYPLAYLSGRRGFYKNEFLVEEGVLIPRPETELVVEVALKRASETPKMIADFGCGSGCIGLSLLKEWPQTKLIAYDISDKACALTKKNAEVLGLKARLQVHNGKVKDIPPVASFQVIVANPPYIAVGDSNVQKSVHDFEPHQALYSEKEGFKDLHMWSVRAFEVLKPGGLYVTEMGASQAATVKMIFEKCGFREIQIHKDLAGLDRVVSGLK